MSSEELEEVRTRPLGEDKGPSYQRKVWLCNIKCNKKKYQPQKHYVIDDRRVENLFYLLTHQENRIKERTFGNQNENKGQALEEATLATIRPRKWLAIDVFAALFHLFVISFLSIPLIFLAILNEVSYSPYSIKDPKVLISSYTWKDPLLVLGNLLHGNGWNIAITILAFVFWVIMSIDLLLYYCHMKFPQDDYFAKTEERPGFFTRTKRRFQWLLFIFSILNYIGYICLALVWLMLGAVLDPTAFLPFTSSAVTFVVFVKLKYVRFKKMRETGEKNLAGFVHNLFGEEISKAIKVLSEKTITNTGLGDETKSIVESESFKSISSKVTDLGLVDQKTIDKIKQQAELLSTDASVAANALGQAAVAVIRDPLVVMKEIESLSDEMKKTAIKKIKKECDKRKIPESLVDTVIQASLKDQKKLKEAARALMVEVLTKIHEEGDSSPHPLRSKKNQPRFDNPS